MARGEQEEIPGFEQKRIPAIERAIIKADEKRAILEVVKEELKTLEHKVRESLHENADSLDKQDVGDGNHRLVYKRAGYEAEIKGHERLSYGKVTDRTAASPPPAE